MPSSVRAYSAIARAADTLSRHFPWFLALYFAFQTLRRLVEPHALGLDEAEQMVMTQAYAWGYGSQPPLYTWLQKPLFDILGRSILSLALLKNGVLFLTFLFFFISAEKLLGDRLKAAAATLSLFFIPQIGWESQRALVHTPFVVCAAAATLLCFVQLVTTRSTIYYVLFGLAIAAGVLAKYSYVVFIVALLVSGLLIPACRRSILDWRMFLVSLPVTLILTGPTLVWSYVNQDLVLSRTRKFGLTDMPAPSPVPYSRTSGLLGPAALLKDVIAFSVACVALHLIAALPFRRRTPAHASASRVFASDDAAAPAAALRGVVVLTPLLSLAILLAFVVTTGSSEFKDRWLQPYLFLTPLICFILLERWLYRTRQIAILWLGATVAFVMALVLAALNQFPDLQSRPPAVTAPFDAIALQMSAEGLTEGTIISPGSFVSGNLLFRLPRMQSLSAEYSRLPLRYEPPILLAWQGELSAAGLAELDVAMRAVCGAPLPQPLAPRVFQAPYPRSERHRLEISVAVLPACPQPPAPPG